MSSARMGIPIKVYIPTKHYIIKTLISIDTIMYRVITSIKCNVSKVTPRKLNFKWRFLFVMRVKSLTCMVEITSKSCVPQLVDAYVHSLFQFPPQK